MKLIEAKIEKFRSIEDTGWFTIDNLVTGLVGKNESGKTNILQALYKLNGVYDDNFNVEQDYPRKEMTKYRKNTHDSNPATAVSARFRLNTVEVANIEERFGEGVLKADTFVFSKTYENEYHDVFEICEEKYIKFLAERLNLKSSTKNDGIFKPVFNGEVKSVNDLINIIESIENKAESDTKALEELREIGKQNLKDEIWSLIKKSLPKFVYFSDYDIMPGKINIPELKSKEGNNDLNNSEKAFLSLLSMADANLSDFESNQSFETLNAQLESASAQLTTEVFNFWTQNKNLKVQIKTHGNEIHITIWNELHQVSVSFDQRSRGFTWFFSFLAYFNDIEVNEDEKLIVLLDEPGLSLHGKAQYDLLKFMDERLNQCQVIYSTHSPFMINPEKFERIRTVEDSEKKGTIISSDLMKSNEDTGFPLRASLGIDLMQTLLISPNNLLVEGFSDLIYIKVLSQLCEEKLNPLWTISPVNGIDKMPAYISLFGSNNLNIVAIVDSLQSDVQKIKKLESNEKGRSFLKQGHLIKISEILNKNEGDIEDLFHPEDYLALVNRRYDSLLRNKPISIDDLNKWKDLRIVKKVECYFSDNNFERFSHYKVASILWEDDEFREAFSNEIKPETETNFSKLIAKINTLVGLGKLASETMPTNNVVSKKSSEEKSQVNKQ